MRCCSPAPNLQQKFLKWNQASLAFKHLILLFPDGCVNAKFWRQSPTPDRAAAAENRRPLVLATAGPSPPVFLRIFAHVRSSSEERCLANIAHWAVGNTNAAKLDLGP